MLLSYCELSNCLSPFWKEEGSSKKFCSKACANLSRSEKVKAASSDFDISLARSFVTEDSRVKQASTMKSKMNRNTGWFARKTPDDQNKFRALMSESAKRRKPTIPSVTGSIKAYGLRFDSQVELFMYEEFMRRGVYAERPSLFNGWLVDFGIPVRGEYVEIKSWYTVTDLQGVNNVVSKLDDRVYMIEEEDAYLVTKVDDLWDYLGDKSFNFKRQLRELAPNTDL